MMHSPHTANRLRFTCNIWTLRTIFIAYSISLLITISSGGSANAQLEPTDLQHAHTLTTNIAGWVALRAGMQIIVKRSGIDNGTAETSDTLAILLGLEDGSGKLDAIIIGAIRAAFSAHQADDLEVSKLYAEQGLTLARAKAIACLVFGHAPKRQAAMVEFLRLSQAEFQSCPQTYLRFSNHWLKIAAPMRAAPGRFREGSIPGQIVLTPAAGSKASARAILLASTTLNEVAAFFNNAITFSGTINIKALDCDRADILPAPDEVRLCYKLVSALADSIEQGLLFDD